MPINERIIYQRAEQQCIQNEKQHNSSVYSIKIELHNKEHISDTRACWMRKKNGIFIVRYIHGPQVFFLASQMKLKEKTNDFRMSAIIQFIQSRISIGIDEYSAYLDSHWNWLIFFFALHPANTQNTNIGGEKHHRPWSIECFYSGNFPDFF